MIVSENARKHRMWIFFLNAVNGVRELAEQHYQAWLNGKDYMNRPNR